MICVECVLPFVLGYGVHCIRRVVRECICDDALNTHLFIDLNYGQKSPREQRILIDTVSYVVQLALYLLTILVVPFQTFQFYSFQQLYVVLQVLSLIHISETTRPY